MAMNPEIKKRWIEALRGGKYKQGVGCLRSTENEYCCLGVLCDITKQETGGTWRNGAFGGRHERDNKYLPAMVASYLGIPPCPKIRVADHSERWLAELNDKKVNFTDIADLIEKSDL